MADVLTRIGLALTLGVAILANVAPARASARLVVLGVDASRYPTVSVRLKLTGSGGLSPTSVSASQFGLADSGSPVSPVSSQLVRSHEAGTDVLMLIDIGLSHYKAQVGVSRDTSRTFIDGVEAPNRVAISTFDNAVHSQATFTSDKSTLNNALDSLSPSGIPSHIYDSLYSSLQGLNTPHQHYVVLLFTDGDDRGSKHSRAACVTLARSHGVPIYTVALGSPPSRLLSQLQGVAALSGGRSFQATNAGELRSIYSQLIQVFAHEYQVTYQAPMLHHRGDHVSLQVSYAPLGLHALTSYVVPSAPWLDVGRVPSSLGRLYDPTHVPLAFRIRNETNSPQQVSISGSGWPAMSVSAVGTPGSATLTVPPYSAGPLTAHLILGTNAAFPGGNRGSIRLTLHPAAPAIHVTQADWNIAYDILAQRIIVKDLQSDLGQVTDLGSGHTLDFALYSTLNHTASVQIQVTGAHHPSVTPSTLSVPPGLDQEHIQLIVSGAPTGQHGSAHLYFRALTSRTQMVNNNANIVYYVPTWWERNWKWFVPLVIFLLIVLYVAFHEARERITRRYDDTRRARTRRPSIPSISFGRRGR